jgi:hypothetical protein
MIKIYIYFKDVLYILCNIHKNIAAHHQIIPRAGHIFRLL